MGESGLSDIYSIIHWFKNVQKWRWELYSDLVMRRGNIGISCTSLWIYSCLLMRTRRSVTAIEWHIPDSNRGFMKKKKGTKLQSLSPDVGDERQAFLVNLPQYVCGHQAPLKILYQEVVNWLIMGVHLDHYLLNQLQQEPSPVQDGYTERFRIKNLSARTMKGVEALKYTPPLALWLL